MNNRLVLSKDPLAKTRKQLVGKIAELVTNLLEAQFERLKRDEEFFNGENALLVLKTIPAFGDLVQAIAQIGLVNKTFSEEYIEEAAGLMLIDITARSNQDDLKETIPVCVSNFVRDLMSFDRDYEVYIPLDGLTLSPEIQELQLGDAILVQMDADRFYDLQNKLQTEQERGSIEDLQRRISELEALRNGFEEQLIKALKSGDEKLIANCRVKKKEVDNKLTPSKESLREFFDHISRLKISTESLKDALCLKYRFSAESNKAIDYAEQEQSKILPLLRYAISSAQIQDKRISLNRQGDSIRGHHTILSIATDKSDFQVVGSKKGTHHPFEITKEHVANMRDLGIFDMAAMVSRSYGKLNEIEDMVKRSINWFSLSQTQPDKGTEFLSLVIILEILLTASDKTVPVSSTVAEGVAILLADSEEQREKFKRRMREIYNLRSAVVHGSALTEADLDEYLVDLRDIVVKSITMIWKLKAAGKFKENKKTDLTGLINSVKFNGPSIAA
jgi:hypothetical protein